MENIPIPQTLDSGSKTKTTSAGVLVFFGFALGAILMGALIYFYQQQKIIMLI